MKLSHLFDYKSFYQKHHDNSFSLFDKSSPFHDQNNAIEIETTPLQHFSDSIQEIKYSCELYNENLNQEFSDEEQIDECRDLLTDNILHVIRLFECTKDLNVFNEFSDFSDLKFVINSLFSLSQDEEISKLFLHMLAFLSSINFFTKIGIFQDETHFQFIIDATNSYSWLAFIILYNYSLDNEENAKLCYLHFPPDKILILFEANYSESDFDDQLYVSALSLISAYCHYNCDENVVLEILANVGKIILLCKENSSILSEAFYSLSMLQIYNTSCIAKANEIGIFDCFNELISLDLESSIIVTMMIYYGESYIQHYKEINLDLDKVVNYAKSDIVYLSSTALWLIWTIIDEDIAIINVFYTVEFFELLKSNISENRFIGSVKLSLLLLSRLIENATTDQLDFCGCDELVDLIMDSNYLESEDELVVNHILRAFGRLQLYYSYVGKKDFNDYLYSHLHNLRIMSLNEEHQQLLLDSYPRLVEQL